MQAPYKEQKASNTVHLPLYWNMLSFSFTIIEFSLDINFRVAMQHTSPLGKGRKRGITYYRTDVFFDENCIDESSARGLKGKGCVNLG